MNPHDYEMLLFSACVLGSWSEWELAEAYCNLALARWRASDNGRQEGLYFLAICQRMVEPEDPERFSKALRYLDAAANLKSRDRNRGDADYAGDPRYMKEAATIAFIWNEKITSGDRRFLHTAPSMNFEQALTLSEAALSLVRNDTKLRMQLVNNLCYGYMMLGGYKNLERALDYLDQLLRLLSSEIGADPADWPINMLDTMVMGLHRLPNVYLQESLLDADSDEMIQILESSVGDLNISLSTQRLVRAHLDDIAAQRGM